jgi:hypothetical protein
VGGNALVEPTQLEQPNVWCAHQHAAHVAQHGRFLGMLLTTACTIGRSTEG